MIVIFKKFLSFQRVIQFYLEIEFLDQCGSPLVEKFDEVKILVFWLFYQKVANFSQLFEYAQIPLGLNLQKRVLHLYGHFLTCIRQPASVDLS